MIPRYLLLVVFLLLPLASRARGQVSPPDPEAPRPIDAFDTVFLEEMTWMEIRDALRDGKTTVIVATGGWSRTAPTW
jgi:creatinine amidohydrolase